MDDIINDFLTETSENMTDLDNLMLALEQNPDDHELVTRIFRIVHTIKGTCGFLGLPRLENLTHKTEDVLGLFRDGALNADPDLISLILEVIDEIKVIIPGIAETGQEPDGDDSAITERLLAVAAGKKSAPLSAEDEKRLFQAAEMIDEHLAAAAEREVTAAADNTAQPIAAKAPNTDKESASLDAQSLRVNVDVLENLMTMVSELVLTRNQLLQISRQSKDPEFAAPLQRLNLVVSDLQEGVMKTRMQPVGNAWAKLPRIVRDICQELDKKIELEMFGQNTELDRQVLEKIRDPLTHMIRNAADHGIESPAERRAAGKPETGKITLRSYHQGGHIMIEVSDDGKGLQLERIKRKIIENGLIERDLIDTLSPQQIQQYIFHAGFSTAEEVTAVSGRGVGMDVVRFNIEKIGGSVEMRSTEGKGTHFTIKIPLTLAIVSALIIGSAEERFAIPQLSVSELVLIGHGNAQRVEYVNNARVLRLRGNLLPLIDLEELMGRPPRADNDGPRYVVVTRVAQFLFGIIVDTVYDLEEIVVKPVTRLLKDLPLFSGNTILGDGKVIMIIDPAGILRVTDINDKLESLQSAEAEERPPENKGEELPLLLFRTNDSTLKAAPLGSISRLENIDINQLEQSDGKTVMRYMDHLMAVQSIDPLPERGTVPLVIFRNEERMTGLVVRDIIDITRFSGPVQSAESQNLLGTAIINGRAADILNPAWFCQYGSIISDHVHDQYRMAAE